MAHKITITVDEDGGGLTHSLSGIPAEAWEKFCETAKIEFGRKHGEDAWAAFLSEVIMAASGGDETVTYFMTDVPRDKAEALSAVVGQAGFTWDRLHAYFLHSAPLANHFRIISMINEENPKEHKLGTFVVTGLDPIAFHKIEKATGKSFEQVMGSLLIAATEGTISFAPENEYAEATPIYTGSGRSTDGSGGSGSTPSD